MWEVLEKKTEDVKVTLNKKAIILKVPMGKTDEIRKVVEEMDGNILVMSEFDKAYKKSSSELEKLEKKELKLKEELKKIALDRKAVKDESIQSRDGYTEIQNIIRESLEQNTEVFGGATLKDLGLVANLPKITNRIKGGGRAKYDDIYLKEWSDIKQDQTNKTTWEGLLVIVNEKFKGKKDLKGNPIHFNKASTLRGVVENWEIKNNLRTRGSSK